MKGGETMKGKRPKILTGSKPKPHTKIFSQRGGYRL